MVWNDPDRRLELLDSLRDLSCLEVNQSKVGVKRCIGGILADKPVVNIDGAVQKAKLEVDEPQKALRLLVPRLEMVGAFELVAGLEVLSAGQKLAATVEVVEKVRIHLSVLAVVQWIEQWLGFVHVQERSRDAWASRGASSWAGVALRIS